MTGVEQGGGLGCGVSAAGMSLPARSSGAGEQRGGRKRNRTWREHLPAGKQGMDRGVSLQRSKAWMACLFLGVQWIPVEFSSSAAGLLPTKSESDFKSEPPRKAIL